MILTYVRVFRDYMKLLIDLTELNKKNTGMERFASQISYNMIKYATDTKQEIIFILLFRKEISLPFDEFTGNPNVEFIILPERSNIVFHLLTLPFALNRIKADEYFFPAYPVPILCFRKNVVCTIHDLTCWDCPDTMDWKYKLFFRVSIKTSVIKCNQIVTVSEFSRQRIIDFFNISEKRISVIYNGIADPFFINNCSESDKKLIREKYGLPDRYILCLSTLQPRKNIKLLLDACEQLWEENQLTLPLVLVGANGFKSNELIRNNNGKLIFTGYAEDKDLPTIYSMAELFVFPSVYEGFGIPPLESMAAGTPVLSSDGPCMPEILGEAAVFFMNNNIEDLKQKLLIMLKKNMTETCRSMFIEQAKKYSWRNEAEKLLELLRKSL